MIRCSVACFVLLALAGRGTTADAKLAVKTEDSPLPAELAAPIQSLLEAKALVVNDDKGAPICTIWPRKELASKAPADPAAGPTYRDVDESTIVGAVRFPKEWIDFRKQKIKPGVYTLRLGRQPMDGDHMGTAPYDDFCLLAPAKDDGKPDTLDPKALHELSAKAVGKNHPGVMLLFPNPKPAAAPSVEAKPNDIWVLNFQRPVNAGGQKAVLGIGLVVAGQSMSE